MINDIGLAALALLVAESNPSHKDTMIRLIMKITGGPTDPSTVIDYTDWAAVDDLARRVCAL